MSRAARVYRHWASNWLDEEGAEVTDDSLIAHLRRALSLTPSGVHVSGRQVFARITTLQAVVAAEFESTPRARRREEFATVLESCLEHAQHAFDATHDPLTGLLNRKGLEQFLRQLSKGAVSPTAATAEQNVVRSAARTASVLAFDLDHFKQINDTHGHLYGDRVLQAFSRRLVSALEEFRTANPQLSACPARMGGEEFVIVLAGPQVHHEASTVAENIRCAVSETPMPSKEEWEVSPEMDLPHESDRRVTVSVGVSASRKLTDAASKHPFLEALSLEADAALYRAKAAGRNVVRRFEDIRAKCGRVLEQHAGTLVVAIDVGKTVGVLPGQEFLVFHPDFSGEKPFVRSDGRSTKRLGTYPRRAHGRITAFDVQPDVSFCRVDEGGPFISDSHLEAIELGSIAHLIADPNQRGGTTAGTDDVDALTRATAEAEDAPFVVGVVNLDSPDEVLKRHGSALVNRTLATLFGVLQERLVDAKIVQLSPFAFGFFLRKTEPLEMTGTLTTMLSEVRRQAPVQTRFSCGYFESPYKRASKGDASEIVTADALSLAKYAALLASREPSGLRAFDAMVASDVVYASRLTGAPATALADYEVLRRAGVRTADLENQVALVAEEERNRELALETSNNAVELAGDGLGYYYWANRAVILFEYVDPLQAWDAFEKALELAGGPLHENYTPAFAMAAVAAEKSGKTTAARALALLERALGMKQVREQFGMTRDDLTAAAAEYRSRGVVAGPQ